MASKTATRPTTSDFEDEVTVDTIPMSYEDFLEWYDGDAGRRGEWVDGEVIPFMMTSDRHARVVTILVSLLTNYFLLRPGGRVFGQSFELRSRSLAAREPDVFVAFDAHLDRLEEMRFVGAADIVVEVISRDSVTRDRNVKHAEYEASGIPEYWLIDPRTGRERIDLFQIDDRGNYRAAQAHHDGRIYSSILPGVWLDPTWLSRDDMPNVIRLAMQMANVSTIPD